ncbi:uncharacterized protein LOC110462047 [Mizuhopecten yessoensis]|uniref:uncharacterized protein LOC110462047 n=1 Tax=Mizuhopecten yessoensis TaxID=6573 RepID=UPI000B45826B|nr:uncharacterized protein LOC110462047 [Mizuhopecten yessoensis]
MSCKEKVIQAIRIIGGCPGHVKVSLVLVAVTFCMYLMGMFTGSWLSGSTPNVRQGLFSYCIQDNEAECCAHLEDFTETQNTTVPAFVQATRAFISIGLIMLCATLVICVVTVMVSGDRTPRGRPYLKQEVMFNMACNALSFIAILIGVIVYGASYRDETWMSLLGLSWSYAFCAMAACLCIVNLGVLYTYEPPYSSE